MNELFEQAASGFGPTAWQMVPRMALALALGGVVAARPWRSQRPRAEMVQTQLLMCVAGALVVSVVGDSLARAFGLVGLGGFIRFRSGLKDPRDAASLFVLIGLGMACGMGEIHVAIVGWAFLVAVFVAMDRIAERRRARGDGKWLLTLEAKDVKEAEKAFAKALKKEGFTSRVVELDAERGKAVLEIAGPEAAFESLRAPWDKTRSVRWEKLGEVAA